MCVRVHARKLFHSQIRLRFKRANKITVARPHRKGNAADEELTRITCTRVNARLKVREYPENKKKPALQMMCTLKMLCFRAQLDNAHRSSSHFNSKHAVFFLWMRPCVCLQQRTHLCVRRNATKGRLACAASYCGCDASAALTRKFMMPGSFRRRGKIRAYAYNRNVYTCVWGLWEVKLKSFCIKH